MKQTITQKKSCISTISKAKSTFETTQENIDAILGDTVNSILNYSKALSVRKSNNLGFIETVLN